jgi:hypothetical protein
VRNRVGLPNRGSARNRTYPGRNQSTGFRSRRPKTGESSAISAAVDLAAGRSHNGLPGPTLRDGRTSRLRGARPNQQLAGQRQRGVVVTFGWQPCSEADRRSTLRRFRIWRTSHQPMSSERAGKSAKAERKRVARLAVWCAEGRNELAEQSIGKTLVLARVARSVVAGHGFGRKHGRGSPNDRSVSNGWQVGKREPEVLP